MSALIRVLLTGVSYLPFWVLHRFSDVLFVLVFYVLKYRRKVVHQNLSQAFPKMSSHEVLKHEKLFYRNFCDLFFEIIKTTSISEEEVLERCKLTTPQVMEEMKSCSSNIVGISSHLGNWEWLSICTSLHFRHKVFGVYTPLTNKRLDVWIKKNRQRFGLYMVTSKQLKEVFATKEKFLIGLLADQAPSRFDRAVLTFFLNQETYFVPGPGAFVAQYQMKPVWAWAKRIGRSRYEWGLEWMPTSQLEQPPVDQVQAFAQAHAVTSEQSAQAIGIVKLYAHWLERYIHQKPSDWLWSHRRWKARNR